MKKNGIKSMLAVIMAVTMLMTSGITAFAEYDENFISDDEIVFIVDEDYGNEFDVDVIFDDGYEAAYVVDEDYGNEFDVDFDFDVIYDECVEIEVHGYSDTIDPWFDRFAEFEQMPMDDFFFNEIIYDEIERIDAPRRTIIEDIFAPLVAQGPDPLDPQEYRNGTLNNLRNRPPNVAFNMGSLGSISRERLFRGTLNEEHGLMWDGVHGDVQMDTDWFRFTINPSCGTFGHVALRLNVVQGMEVFLYLFDHTGRFLDGRFVTNATPLVMKFNPSNVTRHFYVEITPAYLVDDFDRIMWVAEQSSWRQYTLRLYSHWRSNTFTTPILSPATISAPGWGGWSPMATVDLRNNAGVPVSALTTSVTIQGTFRNPLGNSRIALWHGHGMMDEQILGSLTNVNTTMMGFRDSLVQVRSLWGVDYMTQAWNSTSSLQNLRLQIRYIFDSLPNQGFTVPW